MDIRKLQRAIVDGLEDVKAHDIKVFNTEHLSPLFERVIIASGTSNRQTRALASSVRQTVKARGMPVMSIEGEDNGEWIIVDCGAAVAHIMQPAIRDYYHLEEIWGGKAVRMKLDGGSRLGEGAKPGMVELEPSLEDDEAVARAGARKPADRVRASTTARSPAKTSGVGRKKAASPAAAKKTTRAGRATPVAERTSSRAGIGAAKGARTRVAAAGKSRVAKTGPARKASRKTPAGKPAAKSRTRGR